MSHTGNKVSRAMQQDVRAASADRAKRAREQHEEREQRKADHRAGVDHGRGCTHCDVTHGR